MAHIACWKSIANTLAMTHGQRLEIGPSAGDGWKYRMRWVITGDGDRSLSTPLTRYDTGAGTPRESHDRCAWTELDRSDSTDCDLLVMAVRRRGDSMLVVRGW